MSDVPVTTTVAGAAAQTESPGAPCAVLRPRRAQPFFGRHPWVFASAIDHFEGNPADGDVVDLVTHQRQFIARGILNRRSQLQVRLYTWDAAEPIDNAFWKRRIEQAVKTRQEIGFLEPGRGARLIFSEADGLSGLVVDRFAEHLVVQLNALATSVRWPQFAPLLIELLEPQSIILRCDKPIAKEEGIEPRHGLFWGDEPTGPVFIEEHGLRYGVDLLAGQKTGFYLDQAENRLAAARYLHGRRVLDLFCYSGAFGLAAMARGGALEVLGFDSSKKAIATARAHAELNGIRNVRFEVGEVFETLQTLQQQGEQFGAVILDPPKFTRTRRGVREALRAYHRLNRQAIEVLEPGGILVTCSCSGGVTREDFLFILSGVSQKTGRDLQILEQRGASPDHPVSVTCLESDYLKCFICRVV